MIGKALTLRLFSVYVPNSAVGVGLQSIRVGRLWVPAVIGGTYRLGQYSYNLFAGSRHASVCLAQEEQRDHQGQNHHGQHTHL